MCVRVCNQHFPLSQTSHLQLNLNFTTLSGTFSCTRYLNVSNPNKLHFILHSKMSEGESNENLKIANKIDTFVSAAASMEIHQHPSDARTACDSPATTVCTKLAGQDFQGFHWTHLLRSTACTQLHCPYGRCFGHPIKEGLPCATFLEPLKC